jgi:hypothetical protein
MMAYNVHPIMEDSSNLDLTVLADSIQQEITWPMNSVAGRLNTVATVPKMIRPRGRGNFWPGLAAGMLRILDYIVDWGSSIRVPR